MYHPASERNEEEYLELVNRDLHPVSLAGWTLGGGVSFAFPAVQLEPGAYLVVAADLAAFSRKYPEVTNVVGGWRGVLSNTDEEIALRDATGTVVNRVHYADEGDWAVRQRGPLDNGSRGWQWWAAHDGLGSSLELINPALPNAAGQNWASSRTMDGTPGRANSTRADDIPPLLLDVAHAPAVPGSTSPIRFTARVLDELSAGLDVDLHYRDHSAKSPGPFATQAMSDDGQHEDGAAGDGIWGTVLAPQPPGTVIEFYLSARDSSGRQRTWPAPALDEDGRPVQSANALLQIDDEPFVGPHPMLRLVMTGTEQAELLGMNRLSNAEMNATLISTDSFESRIRYHVGVRIRGQGTRSEPIASYRVNIPSDRRWQGQIALNLNSYFSHSQVAGMAIALKAGLPVPSARPAQVRLNGANLARPGPPIAGQGSGFGTWALLEVVNADWAERLFPGDPAGNVYFARRPNTDLRYLGTNWQTYAAHGYSKESNRSENDWSDLIQLTEVLNHTSDEAHLTELAQVADIREWTRYFAVNNFLGNNETSLAIGIGDDYDMYRGVHDPRFRLVPHDLDTILGGYGSLRPTADLFWAMRLPVVNRFLGHPEIAPLYYEELQRLVDTLGRPGTLNALLDQLLGDYVAPATLTSMKDYARSRSEYIASVAAVPLTISHTLPEVSGFPRTFEPTVTLFGTADVVQTRSVRVQGAPANWIAWQGRWTNTVSLLPGINRITVEARDAHGQLVQHEAVDLWYDAGSQRTVGPGTLAAITTWTAAAGPYYVAGPITVPGETVLTIQAGTTVFFAPQATLTVQGRLLAEGTADRPITLTTQPGSNARWGGISLVDTPFPSRMAHTTLSHAGTDRPIYARNTILELDHVRVTHGVVPPTGAVLWIENTSLLARYCAFPNVTNAEIIAGIGMPTNGYVIFEGNTFGTTTGYCDVIDFTGGKRPGPIIQILNNVFLGGSDDGLDLDGTDAHIEGNVFMNFHKDAPRQSDACAIATDSGSEITVARNLFLHSDHGVLLKGGAFMTAQHNVFVGHSEAALALGTTNPVVAPGRGAVLEGNIFWNNARSFAQLQALSPDTPQPVLTARQCLFEDVDWPGPGNLRTDPWFVDAAQDFHLRPGSPALGAGPQGADMGAYVPSGASISGEPGTLSALTSVTLQIGGPGITAYRFRLDDGSWSEEATAVSTPLMLRNLTPGQHQVAVVGMNSAGVWQSTHAPMLSRSWTVDPALHGVVLNEVLARNLSTSNHSGTFPDLIELYNPGAVTIDLTGMRLSDNPAKPGKFVFPANTRLAPGSFLVVFADDSSGAPGLHTGFALSAEGEGVYLYDSTTRGGALLDSVTFGLQIADYSVGRLHDGGWDLTEPTFGTLNRPARRGDPGALRITEWLTAGATDDFVELHNPLPIPVEISGMFLTDNFIGFLDRHRIPALSFLAAQSYTRFVADGNAGSGANHLNFRLSREEGMIALVRSDLTLVDSVLYGSQRFGVSQGRASPASEMVVSFLTPTPGAANQSNRPPTVRIESPMAGQAFVPHTNVTLIASASDPEGALARVEFYSGAMEIGEVRQSPFSLIWSNIPPGSHVLTARAWDAEGAASTSTPVNVLSAHLGIVLSAPPPELVVTQGQSLTLEATVSNGGTPSPSVEFFINAAKVGEALKSPYRWQAPATNAGWLRVHAEARRADGQHAVSAPIALRVLASRPAETVLVATNAVWRFWDRGGTLASDWMSLAYDDGGWDLGIAELGYGEGDEATVLSYGADPMNKHPASYFRQAFVVNTPSDWNEFRLRLLVDDGAVVYLNHEESFRTNLPEGPLGASTFALSNANERVWTEHDVAAERLVPGTNLLAVAVHQFVGTSSDLSFALALTGQAQHVEPWILRQPADQAAPLGQAVTLAVEAAGHPLHFRWYAATDPDQPLATTATLRLAALKPIVTNRFNYYAVVSNALGQVTSRIATVTIDAPDQDGDGLPDYWERLYSLNPLDPSDAIADVDDDGLDNVQEFRLGLNPTVADLVLRALAPPATGPAGTWTLKYRARANIAYLIESAPALPLGTWQTLMRIPPAATSQAAEVNLPFPGTQGFYRVRQE
jgi:hypothetical protein